MRDVPDGPERAVFAVGEGRGGRKLVVIGIPEAGWEYMRGGRTHTFDLRSLGVPFGIVLFGGKDRAEILAQLPTTPETKDLSAEDFGIH
jgi:hypothetical protein